MPTASEGDWADERAREVFKMLFPSGIIMGDSVREYLSEQFRIPADCLRLADGRLMRITHTTIDDVEGEPLAYTYRCVPLKERDS